MKTKLSALFVSFLLLAASQEALAGGPIVAIFDMEDKGSGLSPKVLGNLTDYLGVLLTKGGYRVVPRSEVRARLQQTKKEGYKSCYDQHCQVELGRELAAEKTLATWILKIGKSCQVTATLYDLKKATTERAAAQEADCQEESLLIAVQVIADDLAKHLKLQSAGSSAEEAQIRAMVATKEAEEARRESRLRAEQLVKVQREASAAKQQAQTARAQAEAAEAALKAAKKKVEEATKSQHKVETEQIKKARQEAQAAKLQADQARLKAEKAEAARKEAEQALEELEKLKTQAKAASARADQAEREKKKAQQAMQRAQASAEQARREAELARRHPEGRPTESFNVGIKAGLVIPDVTDIDVDGASHPFMGGLGASVVADFMLTPYLSLGGQFLYQGGEIDDGGEGDDGDYSSTHFYSLLANLKARLNTGPVEFRPGAGLGFQRNDGGRAGKVEGMSITAFVECAFYIGRHFALTVDFSALFQPVGAGEHDQSQSFGPMLFTSLGLEYCD